MSADSPPATPVWTGTDTRESVRLGLAIAALHVVAVGLLVLATTRADGSGGSATGWSVGLGATAYLLGLRHAFDADHIVIIDGTTRKLVADGRRALSTGFWFSAGHSSVVIAATALLAGGSGVLAAALDSTSPARPALSIGASALAGLLLYALAAANLPAWRAARAGDPRGSSQRTTGPWGRVARRIAARVHRPWQLFPAGLVLALGLDTASEIALLTVAGTGLASELSWLAILALPLLFAAGMSLFDTADGALMNAAFRWSQAGRRPRDEDEADGRRTHRDRAATVDLVVTGTTIGAALLVGTIQLVSAARGSLAW